MLQQITVWVDEKGNVKSAVKLKDIPHSSLSRMIVELDIVKLELLGMVSKNRKRKTENENHN